MSDKLLNDLNAKLKLAGNNEEQREAVMLEFVNRHVKVSGYRIHAEPQDPGKEGWKFEYEQR